MSRVPTLSVVADNDLRTPDEPATETVAQRVRRLQAESRLLAKDHAEAFAQAIVDLHAMAAEIHGAGDAYSPGVRSVARDVLLACESSSQTLSSILGRT